MSGREDPVINLISSESEEEAEVPVKAEKEPTPPPPKPMMVTSGLATLKRKKTLDGVKVVQSPSSMAGDAAEARAKIREDARAGVNAADGIPDPRAPEGKSAPTVVKPEPRVGGSANTVVKPEPRVGGSGEPENVPSYRRCSLMRFGDSKLVAYPLSMKPEPGVGGSANTVVKPEAGADEMTEESSEEEERLRAGGKMRVHKPPGPWRKPYER